MKRVVLVVLLLLAVAYAQSNASTVYDFVDLPAQTEYQFFVQSEPSSTQSTFVLAGYSVYVPLSASGSQYEVRGLSIPIEANSSVGSGYELRPGSHASEFFYLSLPHVRRR